VKVKPVRQEVRKGKAMILGQEKERGFEKRGGRGGVQKSTERKNIHSFNMARY